MASAKSTTAPMVKAKKIYLSEDREVFIEYTCDFSDPDSDFIAYFVYCGVREKLSRKQYDIIRAIDFLYLNHGIYPVNCDAASDANCIGNILNKLYKHKPAILRKAEEYTNRPPFLVIKKDRVTGITNYHFHFPSNIHFERVLNPAFPANRLISKNRDTSLQADKRSIEDKDTPFLIYGVEGSGKTAYIVQLYKEFCESSRKSDSYYLFIKYTSNLRQKIAYEIKIRNSYVSDAEAYQAFLDFVKEHKVYIFIDGLPARDKMGRDNIDTITHLAGLINVKLIMTSVSDKHDPRWTYKKLTNIQYFHDVARELLPEEFAKKQDKEQSKEQNNELKARLRHIQKDIPAYIDKNLYVYKVLCLTSKYGFNLNLIDKPLTAASALKKCLTYYKRHNDLTTDVKIYLALLCAMPNLEAISSQILKKAILGSNPKDIEFLISSGLVESYERVDTKGNTTTYCFMHPMMKEAIYKFDTKEGNAFFPRIDSEVAASFARNIGIHSFTIENDTIIDKSFITNLSIDGDDIDQLVRAYASAEDVRDSNGDVLNSLGAYLEAAEHVVAVIDRVTSKDEFIVIWKTLYYTGYLLTFRRGTLNEGIRYLNYALSLAIYLHFNNNAFDTELSASLIAKSADHLSFALSDNIALSSEEISLSYELNAFVDTKIIALSRTNNIKEIFTYSFDNPLALIKTAYLIRNNDEYGLSEDPDDTEIKHYRERAWSMDNYGFTLLFAENTDNFNESYNYLITASNMRERLARITGNYRSDVAWTTHNLAINASLKAIRNNDTDSYKDAVNYYDSSLEKYNKLANTEDCRASIHNNLSVLQYIMEPDSDVNSLSVNLNEAINLYSQSKRHDEIAIVKHNLRIMTERLDSTDELKLLCGARIIIPNK